MREQINLIRRMKLKALILAVTALTTSFSAVAQDGSITLPERKLTAREVFETIQQQTHYRIAVNNSQSDNLSVKITKSPVTVKSVLDRLLEGSNLGYRMDGNYIVITAKPTQERKIETSVRVTRNVTGTVLENEEGAPMENVVVEFPDFTGKQDTTTENGRFRIESVTAGRRIVKLTASDGTIRYREITVPAGADAEVNLVFGGELMSETSGKQTPGNLEVAPKTIAYFTPNTQDHTIHALTDQPKGDLFFVSSGDVKTGAYLPKVAIKTNLLYLATTTPNIAVEFSVAPKWTIDIVAGLNPWDLNGRKGGIRHGLVQPEVRYWFCNRFEKHFIGLHGIYGQYEIADLDLSPFGNDLTDKRYNGWAAGVGISYGYHLPMGKRWGWEFTVGAGYLYLDYKKYNCGECDRYEGKQTKHYFGPTKAGISLIFMIK